MILPHTRLGRLTFCLSLLAIVAGIQPRLALAQKDRLDTLFTCSDAVDRDRFKLCNACRPMRVLVEGLNDDATALGLTKNSLQLAAESRLRAARLYTENYTRSNGSFLYINAHVVSATFSLSLEYNKVLHDSVSGVTRFAMTWDTASGGTHGRDPGFIVQSLSRKLDRFLAEYLRVNENDCRKRE